MTEKEITEKMEAAGYPFIGRVEKPAEMEGIEELRRIAKKLRRRGSMIYEVQLGKAYEPVLVFEKKNQYEGNSP